jgi:hypothetical protein
VAGMRVFSGAECWTRPHGRFQGWNRLRRSRIPRETRFVWDEPVEKSRLVEERREWYGTVAYCSVAGAD